MDFDRNHIPSAPTSAQFEALWQLSATSIGRGVAACPVGGEASNHVTALIHEGCDTLRSLFPKRSALYSEVLGEHLAKAVEAGKFHAVELLVSAGANVNWLNGAGKTPLDVAVQAGRFNIITQLVGAGAVESLQALNSQEPEASEEERTAALRALIRNSQTGAVFKLLDSQKFEPAGLDEPLRDAILSRNAPLIEALVKAGADILAHVSPDSETAREMYHQVGMPRYREVLMLVKELAAEARSRTTEVAVSSSLDPQQLQPPASHSGQPQQAGPLQSFGVASLSMVGPASTDSSVMEGRNKPRDPSPL